MEGLSNKEALSIYKSAKLEYYRAKYPSFPDVEIQAIVKRGNEKPGTTNGITTMIINFVTYQGGFANRIQSAGRKIKTDKGKEIYIPGTTKRGTPDIDAVFKGMSIKIEVKNSATKDRLSEGQQELRGQIESAGAIYFVATSFEQFLTWWFSEVQKETPLRA